MFKTLRARLNPGIENLKIEVIKSIQKKIASTFINAISIIIIYNST